MADKFEYVVGMSRLGDLKELGTVLSVYGEEGWEVFSILPSADWYQYCIIFMKRKAQEDDGG